MSEEASVPSDEAAATSEEAGATGEPSDAPSLEPQVLGDDLARSCEPFASEPAYGEDVRYDPGYQALREEVQKDGAVDWKQIKEGSIEILTGRSKDLTVAGYLTLALFRVDGYGGLGDGLRIVRVFLEEHWEGIFPEGKRPRGRVLALEWLNQRLTPFVENREPRADEIELLPALEKDLIAIRDAAEEHLGKESPKLSNLRKAVSARISAAPAKPGPAAPSERSAPGGGAAAAPTGPAAGLPPEAELEADATPDQVKSRLRPLAAFLRRAEWRSPAPYRVLRSIKWDDLPKQPPADAEGKTRVAAPRPEIRESLKGLLEAGRWADLLDKSEGAFQAGSGTFWLDLQRYTVTALRELSPPAGERAAEAVTEELATLLARFPRLADLSFGDGKTPFADEATQQWIAASVQEDDLLTGAVGGSGAAAEPVLDRERIEEARSLLGQNKLTPALDLLQSAVDEAPDPRARFRARMGVGQVLLKANRHPWARSVLEELREDMHGFELAAWEPEVAVELLKMLAICYGRMLSKASGEDQSDLQRALNKVKSELSRLDLRAAAAVDEALAG